MPQISGTVTKALALLDEFLDGTPELSMTQLAARSGIHKTTVLRLCASLEEVGFLEREAGMAYRIGPKIWQLAQNYRGNFRIEEFIRPLLRNIRDEIGESVSFYVPEGDERICLFRENSQSVIRHHVEEGTRLRLDSGVVGRVLMAYMQATGADFDTIRKNGYLTAQGREPHTTSVAVPVIDGLDKLRGALVVSGPTFRFSAEASVKALDLLKEAAAKLKRSLPHAIEARRAGSGSPASAKVRAFLRPRASGTEALAQSRPQRPQGRRRQSD